MDGRSKEYVLALRVNLLHDLSTRYMLTGIIDEQSAEASKISYDKKSERVTLNFPSEILPSHALLEINFTGILNSSMAGFYRSKYKPAVTPAASVAKDDEYHYMFSTHFEACNARQAFPCFDEPNLKATFDFEIEIPEGQVALSNMPEKSVVEGKGKEWVQSCVFREDTSYEHIRKCCKSHYIFGN